MSGLVATAPPTTPPESVPDTIVNDGWFPNLKLSDLRDVQRTDGTVTDPRLREAAVNGMIQINSELSRFRDGHIAAGINSLAGVESSQINGESRLVALYRRAVFCTAKADLIERYRDLDSTNSGQRRAEDMDPAIAEQMRNARWATQEILGRTHSVVELI